MSFVSFFPSFKFEDGKEKIVYYGIVTSVCIHLLEIVCPTCALFCPCICSIFNYFVQFII